MCRPRGGEGSPTGSSGLFQGGYAGWSPPKPKWARPPGPPPTGSPPCPDRSIRWLPWTQASSWVVRLSKISGTLLGVWQPCHRHCLLAPSPPRLPLLCSLTDVRDTRLSVFSLWALRPVSLYAVHSALVSSPRWLFSGPVRTAPSSPFHRRGIWGAESLGDLQNRMESQFRLHPSCATGAKAYSCTCCALHISKVHPLPLHTRPGVRFGAHIYASWPCLCCTEDKGSVTLFSFLPACRTPLSKSDRKATSLRH